MMQFTATIAKVENRVATLKVGATEFKMPVRMMPKNVAENDTVVIEVLSSGQFEARQKNIARAVLCEILNSNDKDKKESAE